MLETTLTEQRLIGLARTLTRVRQDSPYYRALIPPGRIGPDNAPEILRRLPQLDPADWASVRGQLRTSGFEGIVTGYTNGTSGIPKAFYSTEAERAALRAAQARDERRRLRLAGFNHGAAEGVGLAGEGDYVPLLSMRYFDLAADLLADGAADGTRIRVLAGATRPIKMLTLHMLERFEDISGFGIETIEVGRQFLSRGWESRLRQWWGADVEVVYGFSELRMCNARKCAACAHHHFPPSCVAEVIDAADPDRLVPLGGRGSLLVTALHPYVEFEPRIRYRPGDLVELAAQPCPRWGEAGFLPMGREANCVALGAPGAFLTPADCVAALADLPQVAVGGLAPDTGLCHLEAGSPRINLVDDAAGPQVHVELRFDPRAWPAEAEAVTDQARAALPDGVQVIAHGPGRLQDVIFL